MVDITVPVVMDAEHKLAIAPMDSTKLTMDLEKEGFEMIPMPEGRKNELHWLIAIELAKKGIDVDINLIKKALNIFKNLDVEPNLIDIYCKKGQAVFFVFPTFTIFIATKNMGEK